MAKSSETMVYGINAVGELIRQRGSAVHRLMIDRARDDKRIRQLLTLADEQRIAIERVGGTELDRQAGQLDSAVVHQGVIALCSHVEVRDEQYLMQLVEQTDKPFLLVLDGVTDPHNLGACLRSANAAGVDAVIIPKDKAVGLTAAVRKVASGAAELTPLVQVKNLARTLSKLQQAGVWLMGAAGETDRSLYELDLSGSLAVVMGAEGSGLRRLTRERCDQLFAIPMLGGVESLNVSVAAGISLYEALRQRQKS